MTLTVAEESGGETAPSPQGPPGLLMLPLTLSGSMGPKMTGGRALPHQGLPEPEHIAQQVA